MRSARSIRRGLFIAASTILLTTLSVTSAAAAPPSPAFGPGIDGYQPYVGQSTCNPTPKPGVVEFRDLLRAAYGRPDSGISRDCASGGQSEHKEGRALDYPFNVNNSGENAQANDVLNWLLATDRHGNAHALARRLGIMYIIWNRRIWESYNPGAGWQSYTGANPHTDHIHFSFGWPGANRQTTWWTGRLGGPYEVGVFRQSEGRFYLRGHDGGSWTVNWGTNADVPVTGDWNGDNRFEVGIWRPSEGRFHLRDHNGNLFYVPWGVAGDYPVTGDWNGDGRFEVGIWRGSEGRFHLRDHNGNVFYVNWGAQGDIPVTADWNGNGRFEVGIWRPSEGRFHLRGENGQLWHVQWGINGDIPVTGDWNGDGPFEVGIWRASEGRFYLRGHDGGSWTVQWGTAGDRPVAADWNGV
jgi:uncharacterized cupin superfamily protein